MTKGLQVMVNKQTGSQGATGDNAGEFTSGPENTNIRRPTLVEEGAQTAKQRGGRRSKAAKAGGEGDSSSGNGKDAGAGKGGQGSALEGESANLAAASAAALLGDGAGLATGEPGDGDDETRIEVSSAEVGGAGQPKKRGAKATQPDLIEDMRIEELHSAALDFASKRDARIEAGRLEKNAKDLLLAQMKKHGKETYSADGLTCKIVHEKENIKVEINKGDGDE